MNDLVQRVTNLERIGRNVLHTGEIASVSGNQAKLRVTLINDQTILTSLLPVIGRSSVSVGEPASVIMPLGDFASGVIVCLLKDPELDELANEIDTLEGKVSSLEENMNSALNRIGSLERRITQLD